MEEENCKVACKVDYDYTSSEPITSSNAHYKIKDSSGLSIENTQTPAPSNGEEIVLSGIQSAGEYELTVTLTVNGITDQETAVFQVDKCNFTSCKTPSIKNVSLGENDQIIMDYSVDGTDLYAVQYQIATDSDFNNIVQVRVVIGSDYKPTEYIEMNDGTIKNNTRLYIRARKHCSPSEVSGWSNVVVFTSGTWADQKVLYPFDAYCVSDAFNGSDPTNIAQFKASICFKDPNPLMKKVNLSTMVPQNGSFIYTNGLTPEKPGKPGNLTGFDDSNGGVSTGFNQYGIRWIRFENNDPALIYDVDPKTGQIVGVSRYTCNN